MSTTPKRALITGITGQDGSYLAELLLEKGYEVHGVVRRVAAEKERARLSRIAHLLRNTSLILHVGDVTDQPTLWRLIASIQPHEVYHLAGVTSIPASFADEFGTFVANTWSTHYLLAAIKELSPNSRFYFAGTSDVFSGGDEVPQNEMTPLKPTTPYGVSKVASFYLTKLYRETHGLFACTGICFSHESPRRGYDFMTRKVTTGVARIKLGLEEKLVLGNLAPRRDWGFAGDYVCAMWLMLQADEPDDYVVGTGESHTIREFVDAAFAAAGLDSAQHLVIDESLYRPGEAKEWLADPGKIRRELGWKQKVSFSNLVRDMVNADLAAERANS